MQNDVLLYFHSLFFNNFIKGASLFHENGIKFQTGGVETKKKIQREKKHMPTVVSLGTMKRKKRSF